MRTHPGTLSSSMPSLSSLSARQATVPRLIRFTAYGTVMFGLASLVNQHFGSHPAFSSHTSHHVVCYRLLQGWESDVIAKDHRMFC